MISGSGSYKVSTISKIHVPTVCQPSEHPRWSGNVTCAGVRTASESLSGWRPYSWCESGGTARFIGHHDESRRTYFPVMICPPVMNLQLQDIRIRVLNLQHLLWKIRPCASPMKDRQYALNVLLDFLVARHFKPKLFGVPNFVTQQTTPHTTPCPTAPRKTNPQNLRTATIYLK